MAVYKRGGTYWFEFIFRGRRIRKSTMQTNKRAAENIESAYRTKLAQGLVGIGEKKIAPTLKKAFETFLAWSKVEHSSHSNTHKRYQTSSKPLLAFLRPRRLSIR
jgi:hypothetical protein